MRGKNFKVLGILFLLGIVLLSMNFVSAANAVTLNLPAANSNVSGTAYTISASLDTNTLNLSYAWFTFTYNNGTTVTIASHVMNQSAGVFNTTWNSATGAKDGNNITFLVIVANETNYGNGTVVAMANTTDDSTGVTVDNTAATISLSGYTNRSLKTNTLNLTVLNISVVDINITSTVACKVNVNGTNSTLLLTKINDTYGTCNTTDVRLTNLADGNQTINIYANNSVGLWGVLSSYIVIIDTNPPTVTLPFYANGTIKNSSNTLILNVSVSDDVTNATMACKVEINGTNTTVGVSNGWCNTTNAAGLGSLTDGNHTIKVYANNTQNLFTWSNTYAVFIDSNGPTVELTAADLTKDVITLAITASDGTGTGVSSCTVDRSGATVSGTTSVTESGLSCATSYTYVVTCSDRNGHSASATKTVSTNGCGGGAGGGGGGTASRPVVNTVSQITPGAASITRFTDPALGVKQIEITVNNPAQNVRITVTKYDGKPAAVSVARTGAIKYLQINVDNVQGKLDKAKIQFKVEKSKVTNKNNVVVSKFDEAAGRWNDLTTTFASEDSTYYYYDAEVNSFSYFAISEPVTGTGGAAGGGAAEGGRSLTWLWILIALVIVVVVWLMLRKKQ